jgi:hypothetical protein
MTYSFVKPDQGPSPKLDVTKIQTNFSQFASVFNVDHTALNNTNQGDHESVILVNQSQDPVVTQDLAVLYCKTASGSTGNQPQLFVALKSFLPTANDPTTGPFFPERLTYNVVNTSGPIYQSFLPGGKLLYFGSTSNIAIPITLSPTPLSILIAIATPNNLSSIGTPQPFTVSTAITGANTFKINSNATGSYTFGWVAIGSI